MREEHYIKNIVDHLNRNWKVFGWFLAVCLFGAGLNVTSHPMYSASGMIVINQTETSPLQAISARVTGFQMGANKQAIERYMLFMRSRVLYKNLATSLYRRSDIKWHKRNIGKAKITFINREILEKHFPKLLRFYDGDSASDGEVERFAKTLKSIINVRGNGPNTIQITARSAKSETSVLVVNELVALAVKEISKHNVKELNNAKDFLENQLGQVSGRIDQIEAEIVSYKEQSKSYSLSQIEDEMGNESIDLQRELVEFKVKIDHNNRILKKLKRYQKAGKSENNSDALNLDNSKFSRASRIFRLEKENEMYRTRLDSLRPLARKYAKRQEALPKTEQALRAYNKKLELEYAYYAEIKRHILKLEMQYMSLRNIVSKVEKATAARSVKFMSPSVQAGLAVVIAMVLAGLLTFILETLHPHVLHRKDLEDLDVTYLGGISDFRWNGWMAKAKGFLSRGGVDLDGRPPFSVDHTSQDSVCFRYLRSRLLYHKKGGKRKSQVIALVSPHSGEGKTFLSYNLSQAIAITKKKTLVIDCDFRKGSLTEAVKGQAGPGMSDLLMAKTIKLEGAIQSLSENMDFISVGSATEHVLEHIPDREFERVLGMLKSRYEYILLDTPALMPVADTLEIVRFVDKVILSVVQGQTRMDAAHRSVERLRHVVKCPIAFVFNKSTCDQASDYDYYYQKKSDLKSIG